MASETDVYPALTEIFHDVFMRDDIALSPTLTARQVQGWDSFKQIEIIMASEEAWKIKFNTRELDSLLSVGDLVRLIVAKTGGYCQPGGHSPVRCPPGHSEAGRHPRLLEHPIWQGVDADLRWHDEGR